MVANNNIPETGGLESARGNNKTYIIGYVLSVGLTIAAYLMVRRHLVSGHTVFTHHFLYGVIIGLAVIQLLVQLIFFFHMDRESRPRWNLQVFIFMFIILFIVVAGSLWIMANLNYRMTPQQMNQYMQQQASGGL